MQDIASSSTVNVIPSVKMVGVVTVRALDSLPLPLLVVVFIACLALLQWPISQSSPLLPTFTPPTTEKERLSPILEKNSTLYTQLQMYSLTPTSSATTTATGSIPTNLQKKSGSGLIMPLPKGRKASYTCRKWRSGLGVVEEVEGELVTLDV